MKSKRVLIVDDNDLNRKLFENLIGQVCLFESAKNGLEALALLEGNRFDLILMDIQMPQMDGLTAMKKIKLTDHDHCPIIAITAFAEMEDRHSFIEQGFDEFMIKPIRPREFLESIKAFLSDKAPEPHKIEQNKPISLEPVILDMQIVKQLMKYNQPETIKNVFLDFVKECDSLFNELDLTKDAFDFKQLEAKLHTIKGNSGTLGANSIFLLAQEGEINAKLENRSQTRKILHELQNEILNFKKYIMEETIFNQ
ncbi:response regulator [Algoriphagus aestuarii]|nr:response regulator [Algoriphagus aestuarii]